MENDRETPEQKPLADPRRTNFGIYHLVGEHPMNALYFDIDLFDNPGFDHEWWNYEPVGIVINENSEVELVRNEDTRRWFLNTDRGFMSPQDIMAGEVDDLVTIVRA